MDRFVHELYFCIIEGEAKNRIYQSVGSVGAILHIQFLYSRYIVFRRRLPGRLGDLYIHVNLPIATPEYHAIMQAGIREIEIDIQNL